MGTGEDVVENFVQWIGGLVGIAKQSGSVHLYSYGFNGNSKAAHFGAVCFLPALRQLN